MGKVAKKRAVPVRYDEDIASRILQGLAMGQSLKAVCSDPGMPAPSAVYLWMIRHEAFKEMYTRAKQDGADALFEEIFDIADDASGDYDEDGTFRSEHVQRSRLRIETRKWALSKLRPQKYGDRVDLNHGGQMENPLALLIQQLQGSCVRLVPVCTIDMTPEGEEE